MEHKNALITGGTSGIGLSIVRYLAAKNYNISFIGTNVQKGKEIEQELFERSKGTISFIHLDLRNLNSVYQFARDFREKHKHLNLLANIAGGLFPKRKITQEGIETNLAISYFSAYILSTELISILKNAQNSKIVNVGAKPSIVQKESIDFNDFQMKDRYNAYSASSTAVHAKTVLTEILAKRYAQFGIAVNSFDPGMVNTNLMRQMNFPMRAVAKLIFMFASTNSALGVKVCLGEDPFSSSGKLFTKAKSFSLQFPELYKHRLIAQTEELLSRSLNLNYAKGDRYLL